MSDTRSMTTEQAATLKRLAKDAYELAHLIQPVWNLS